MIDLFLQTLSIGGWHVNNKSKYPTYSNEKNESSNYLFSIGLSKSKKKIIIHCKLLYFAETFCLI